VYILGYWVLLSPPLSITWNVLIQCPNGEAVFLQGSPAWR
jgi:hypothetical protein